MSAGNDPMFTLHNRPARLCDGISRRELLRVGGLSALGLSLPALLQARTGPETERGRAGSFGRAKNVIFLWLQGGPPQHETFDPKPDAPAEIRGEFRPIRTNVPGIQIGELLPRTAALADRLAVVRSMCTHSDLHDASGYWVLTGYRYTGQQSRQISPGDWPYLGSVIRVLKPSEKLPSHTSVWLPDVMRLNDNVQPAGQTGGFLGRRWDPTARHLRSVVSRFQGREPGPAGGGATAEAVGPAQPAEPGREAIRCRGARPRAEGLRSAGAGSVRPFDVRARRGRRSTSAASRRGSASAMAGTAGDNACSWPAG